MKGEKVEGDEGKGMKGRRVGGEKGGREWERMN